MPIKVLSYNVNGIRSALSKNLVEYLQQSNPNIICFQEIKAEQSQVDNTIISNLGYEHYWFSAQKKGYAGVGIWSNIKPLNIQYGCAHPLFDAEGRVLRLDFEQYSVISAYFPSGTTGDERQNVKYAFLEHFFKHIQELKKTIPNLIICGDYNICHNPIDIHNPTSNKNTSGFLLPEREWMDTWFANEMVDTFREKNTNPHQYTWWSYRAGARSNNKGWRIDYISVSSPLKSAIINAGIDAQAVHSDHCPIWVELNI